jgi:hypothetical protein
MALRKFFAKAREFIYPTLTILASSIFIGALVVPSVPIFKDIERYEKIARCKNNLSQMFMQAFNYKAEFGGKSYEWPPGTGDTFTMSIYNALASVGRERDLTDVWSCPVKGGTALGYDGPKEEVTDASKNNLIIFRDKPYNHDPDNNEGNLVTKAKAVYECKGQKWKNAIETGYYE